MPVLKAYEFAVAGRGNFPLSMLEADRCYPIAPVDVTCMNNTGAHRTLWLRSLHSPTPTMWQARGWEVVAINTIGLPYQGQMRAGPDLTQCPGYHGHVVSGEGTILRVVNESHLIEKAREWVRHWGFPQRRPAQLWRNVYEFYINVEE